MSNIGNNQFTFKTIEERFWSKVNKTDTCWLWIASRNNQGYGHFSVGDKIFQAHRWSYEHFIGPIPEEMNVCHKCDNPPCIRPDHLFIGNDSDNTNDCISKGRYVGNTRLTEDQVRYIKSYPRYYGSNTDLAKQFGVSQPQICVIRKGKSRKHII